MFGEMRKSAQAMQQEAVEPDDWDLRMIEEAKRENDGTAVSMADLADDLFCQRMMEDYENDPDPDKDALFSLEDCMKEWGITDV